MRKAVVCAVLAAAVVLSASDAAAQVNLYANLTNDQEVPPTVPQLSVGGPRAASYGFATFLLNAAQTQLSMSVTIYNIDVTGTQTFDTNDNLVNAHIHVGAPPGANAPVRWGFFGAPDNDVNPDQLVVTPFSVGVGGTFTSIWDLPEGNAGTTLATNLQAILAGQSYINFHTVQFAGGEIRGQILVTPEPASIALLASGLAVIAFVARRRRV